MCVEDDSPTCVCTYLHYYLYTGGQTTVGYCGGGAEGERTGDSVSGAVC